jgi:hypothetical protein
MRVSNRDLVPADLAKVMSEVFNPLMKARVVKLLTAVRDCDNFKIYINCVRDMVQRPDDWKGFFEESQWSLYTSDYHLKLPLLRFDTKQAILTYSETANVLMLSRPFELGRFFKILPLSNQYLFNSRPALPTLSNNAKLTVQWSNSAFLLDMADTLLQNTTPVHVFRPLSAEDIEKYANEGKSILVHGIETWRTKDAQEFLSRSRFFSSTLNKSRIVVLLKERFRDQVSSLDYFDNHIESHPEMSIRAICTYFLRVESSLMFNTHTGTTPSKHDLLEACSKIDYDFSEEVKGQKETQKDLPKLYPSSPRLTDLDHYFEVSILNTLTTVSRQAAGSSVAIDENRTKLILYMMFAVVIKNLEENRKQRHHKWWISTYDTLSIIKSVFKSLLSLKENSALALKQCIQQALFFESERTSCLLPVFSSCKLIDLFDSVFLAAFENLTTSIFKDNEVYRIAIKSIRTNYSEIFSTLANFPHLDPSSLSLLSDRDVYLKSQVESVDLLYFLRFMQARKITKVSFTSDLKILNSKNEPALLTEGQKPNTGFSVMESIKRVYTKEHESDKTRFDHKQCLVMLLTSMMDTVKLNPSKLLLTNSLISSKLHTQVDELNHGTAGQKSLIQKKVSLRQSIHRKSILENFRADMMKRYSIRNRGNFIETLEGRDSTVAQGVQSKKSQQGSIIPLNAPISAKGSFIHNRDSAMIIKQNSIAKNNIRPSGFAPKTGSTYFLQSEPGKLEFVAYPPSIKRDLFEKSKVLQSAMWTQVLALNSFITDIQQLISCKIELYSGEFPNCFMENEDIILSKIYNASEFSYPELPADVETVLKFMMNKTSPLLSKHMPVNLSSIFHDSSFVSAWQSLAKRVSYIEHLANRDDAQPTTGVYDLAGIFKPINLITSFMIHYSFKMNVGRNHQRNP